MSKCDAVLKRIKTQNISQLLKIDATTMAHQIAFKKLLLIRGTRKWEKKKQQHRSTEITCSKICAPFRIEMVEEN